VSSFCDIHRQCHNHKNYHDQKENLMCKRAIQFLFFKRLKPRSKYAPKGYILTQKIQYIQKINKNQTIFYP